MGRATEEPANHVSLGIGSLLAPSFANAAEHGTAILVAYKNKRNPAMNIAIG